MNQSLDKAFVKFLEILKSEKIEINFQELWMERAHLFITYKKHLNTMEIMKKIAKSHV